MGRNRQELSKVIIDRLTALSEYKNAKNLLCYASFASEVETTDLMAEILADGKKLYLPKCEVETHEMQAVRVTDLSSLEKGAYGIAEPVGEGEEPKKIDLVIVPLVAFDRSLARLGYGGGYYDRFLPKTDAIRIAIAFSEQECEKIPLDETDIRMDIIITEKEEIRNAF